MYSLNDEQIRALAPAAFSEAPAPTVGPNYGFVRTVELIGALRDQGWVPSAASQARSRKDSTVPYTKHLLRFRREEESRRVQDDLLTEIILRNDHRGAGYFVVDGGLWRFVCLNGTVIGNSLLPSIFVRHTRKAIEGVLDAVADMARLLPEAERTAEHMRSVQLSDTAQHDFALRALQIRWPEGTAPVRAADLLLTMRAEDESNDLWTVYQRIQEHLTKGVGMRGQLSPNGRRRAIRKLSAHSDLKINKALWDLAQEILV